MVADYLSATQGWGGDQSAIASAGASSVLDVCRYLQDLSKEFDGDEGGLYIAPSLGLELADSRTDVYLGSQAVDSLQAGAQEAGQTQLARGSKLPSICMPVSWKQALHGEKFQSGRALQYHDNRKYRHRHSYSAMVKQRTSILSSSVSKSPLQSRKP